MLYPDFYSAYHFPGTNWYNACRNKQFYPPDGLRPCEYPNVLEFFFVVNSEISHLALKFRLILEMNIFGLPGVHASTSQTSDASCPVELPINAA